MTKKKKKTRKILTHDKEWKAGRVEEMKPKNLIIERRDEAIASRHGERAKLIACRASEAALE